MGACVVGADDIYRRFPTALRESKRIMRTKPAQVLMSKSVDALVAEALKLTREERTLLADRVLASLSDDPGLEEAWAVEVARRLGEIETDGDVLLPAADAIARARRALE
ncbi:MAG: addiction module protein [Rudaea sp.]